VGIREIRVSGSGAQGVDQLIQFVRQRRVHVSLNYQPSTLNRSGGLFSVAPALRPPARQNKPRNGPRTHRLNETAQWRVANGAGMKLERHRRVRWSKS
jgi:hypothetical protein